MGYKTVSEKEKTDPFQKSASKKSELTLSKISDDEKSVDLSELSKQEKEATNMNPEDSQSIMSEKQFEGLNNNEKNTEKKESAEKSP